MKKIRIIVIAKAPVAGFAKTRLIPALGAAGAANLAQRLLLHTINNVTEANLGAARLCVTPEPENPVWDTLRTTANIEWEAQSDGDLGQRLAATSKRALAAGESVILMGTDCPALTAKVIRQAAQSLAQFNAVIIPATDGGYTLLGINEFHPSLFDGISWSTDKVCSQTLQRIRLLRWRVEVLSTLQDIDEPDDLRWLPETWKADLYPSANKH